MAPYGDARVKTICEALVTSAFNEKSNKQILKEVFEARHRLQEDDFINTVDIIGPHQAVGQKYFSSPPCLVKASEPPLIQLR
jgi:hypothetical protein